MGQPQIDKVSFGTVTVTRDHSAIHDGDSYTLFSSGAGGTDTQSNIQIDTPNSTTWLHMLPMARSSTEANFKLFEDPTLSGGTSMITINRNRIASNTSSTIGLLNPVISGAIGVQTSGTNLIEEHFGAGRNTGGVTRGITEWILKSGTTYLFSITSESASSDISMELNWYENVDKS